MSLLETDPNRLWNLCYLSSAYSKAILNAMSVRADVLTNWEEWLTGKLYSARTRLAESLIEPDPFHNVEEWQAHVDFFASALDTTCKLIAATEFTEDDT